MYTHSDRGRDVHQARIVGHGLIAGGQQVDNIFERGPTAEIERAAAVGDPVAGRADAVIVPDIVSGNALFKALVYVGGGCAGGVVMGAAAPILLTSRADPPAARLASVALASLVRAG